MTDVMTLNTATLDQFFSDVGIETGKNLIGYFIEETVERLQLIEDLARDVESLDLTTLQREAHSLKSAARTYGADDLGDLANRIDLACKAADAPLAHQLCQGFKDEGLKHIDILQRYLDTL